MMAPTKHCSSIQQLLGQSETGVMQVAEMMTVCLSDPVCNAGDAAAARKGWRPKAAHEA